MERVDPEAQNIERPCGALGCLDALCERAVAALELVQPRLQMAETFCDRGKLELRLGELALEVALGPRGFAPLPGELVELLVQLLGTLRRRICLLVMGVDLGLRRSDLGAGLLAPLLDLRLLGGSLAHLCLDAADLGGDGRELCPDLCKLALGLRIEVAGT